MRRDGFASSICWVLEEDELMARSVFDFENEDRVESPERLNEYIRVAGPGTWVMISALVLVLVAFVLWGFIGTIPETVTVQGYFLEGDSLAQAAT